MRNLGVTLGLLLSLFCPAIMLAQSPAAVTVVVEPPPPAHPATIPQIKEYWELTHAMVLAHSLMNKTADAMQATSAPYFPKSFWDDLRSSFEHFDLESPMIKAYQRYLSEDDMAQILVFYQSPAGRHFLAAQPLVIAMSQEAVKQAAGELGQQVYDRHKDEIDAAKAKYDTNKP
jgi:hypothetical protein